MKLDTFLSQCHLLIGQVEAGLQLRTLGDPDSGTAADVECVEDDAGPTIVVTVWEWKRDPDGTSRQRVGRLVFAVDGGELLSAEGSDPGELARMIAGMERLSE